MDSQQFDCEIMHREGALHYVPDALSRELEGRAEVSELTAVEDLCCIQIRQAVS